MSGTFGRQRRHIGLSLLLALFSWLATQSAAAQGLTIETGDIIFGGLTDPGVTKQQTPVCFDNATGTLGPCTDAVAGLPEALRNELCALYSFLPYLPPTTLCDFELLQNDGWVDGANLVYQGGFETGESAAVTLGPLSAPSRVNAVYLFFGPTEANLFNVTLTIYEDDGSSSDPGTQLYSGDYALIGSSDMLQVIDLKAFNIQPSSSHVRVSLTVHHDFFPGVARDDDLNIQTGRNWIHIIDPIPAWIPSETFLVTGDWVIRALVEPL